MGTRGLINVVDEQGDTLLTIYRQYDCYPSGLGQELQNLLSQSEITNGYNSSQEIPMVFNGFGCMAAYIVKSLKDSIGNVYIYPPNITDVGEEYIYTLYPSKSKINIKVISTWDNNAVLYDGPISKLDTSKFD